MIELAIIALVVITAASLLVAVFAIGKLTKQATEIVRLSTITRRSVDNKMTTVDKRSEDRIEKRKETIAKRDNGNGGRWFPETEEEADEDYYMNDPTAELPDEW